MSIRYSFFFFFMQVKDEKALGYYYLIIYNIVQSEFCIYELREMGIVEVFLFYFKLSKDKILLTILVSLVDIVDDSEVAYLEIGGDLFKFLLKILKFVMNDRYRRCKGWFVKELVRSNYVRLFIIYFCNYLSFKIYWYLKSIE